MDINKEWDWKLLGIGFWSGVAVISLVNIVLIMENHYQFLYDEYIFGVSIVAIIFYVILRSRSTQQ
jgi:hypothetical protein